MSDDDYKVWWEAQFPCPCGHSPDKHYLAPQDGICLACGECHGEGGALISYGKALIKTVQEKEKQS